MGQATSQEQAADVPASPMPAAELAGVWRAAAKEKWKFTTSAYGPRWREFEETGFDPSFPWLSSLF